MSIRNISTGSIDGRPNRWIVRCQFVVESAEVENGRNLANQMIARHYRVKIERVEQLALVPIVPAYHDLPPPQCFLREWNHRSLGSATDFCNKIGQQQK